MLYYYNVDGKFQKESSREYKTEKGAMDKLKKEGQGAVFDETGKMILSLVDEKDVPEGALDTKEDGSVPVFNENNELIGTADAEIVAEATGETGSEEEEPDHAEREPEETEQTRDEPEELVQNEREPFDVQTSCDSLRIRSGAGKDYRIVGYIREKAGQKKNHTIVREKDGWGKLASGEGWIALAFTKRVS